MQQIQEKDYTRRLDAGLWRRLIQYMKPYHKYLYAIMATMAVSALCDTLFPLLTREAIDTFIGGAAQMEGCTNILDSVESITR